MRFNSEEPLEVGVLHTCEFSIELPLVQEGQILLARVLCMLSAFLRGGQVGVESLTGGVDGILGGTCERGTIQVRNHMRCSVSQLEQGSRGE